MEAIAMNSMINATDRPGSGKPATKTSVRAHLHELQNHLHLATMEVELAQLQPTKPVDCVKLLNILAAFKQALDQFREQLLSPNNSGGQPG